MCTLTANRIRCGHCREVIESTSVGTYTLCGCGKVSVAGGPRYLRRGTEAGARFADLSEWASCVDPNCPDRNLELNGVVEAI